MFLLYFILWVVFNGNFTFEIAIFGVIIAAAIFTFTCKFMDYSIDMEKQLFKNIFSILHYIIVLVIEIVKANFAVIHLILSEEEEVEPLLVSFKSDLSGPGYRSTLANAITLTPGTITVLLEDNVYTVHCLDETLAEGINKSVFVDMLTKMEKQ